MSFEVRLTVEAEADLLRLYDFIIEREVQRSGVAGDPDATDLAEDALNAIRAGFATLTRFPFTCRKIGASPFIRELVVPFGGTGFVVLFEVVDAQIIWVAAVRHQREADYR